MSEIKAAIEHSIKHTDIVTLAVKDIATALDEVEDYAGGPVNHNMTYEADEVMVSGIRVGDSGDIGAFLLMLYVSPP